MCLFVLKIGRDVPYPQILDIISYPISQAEFGYYIRSYIQNLKRISIRSHIRSHILEKDIISGYNILYPILYPIKIYGILKFSPKNVTLSGSIFCFSSGVIYKAESGAKIQVHFINLRREVEPKLVKMELKIVDIGYVQFFKKWIYIRSYILI